MPPGSLGEEMTHSCKDIPGDGLKRPSLPLLPADPAGKPLQTSKPSQLVLACQLCAQPQQRFASSSTRQQARAKQVEDQALLNPLGPALESAA
jgi:hypothetical protein